MAYAATGTAGNDVLDQTGDTGPGTIVGLAGDDCILSGSGPVQGCPGAAMGRCPDAAMGRSP